MVYREDVKIKFYCLRAFRFGEWFIIVRRVLCIRLYANALNVYWRYLRFLWLRLLIWTYTQCKYVQKKQKAREPRKYLCKLNVFSRPFNYRTVNLKFIYFL